MRFWQGNEIYNTTTVHLLCIHVYYYKNTSFEMNVVDGWDMDDNDDDDDDGGGPINIILSHTKYNDRNPHCLLTR